MSLDPILGGLAIFLRDRGLEVQEYWRWQYLEIRRPRSSFSIVLDDGQFVVSIDGPQPHAACSVNIEIADPRSLQSIYELIMSKRWK